MSEFDKAAQKTKEGGAEWGVSDKVSRDVPIVPSVAQFRSTGFVSRRMNDAIERAVDGAALQRLRKLRNAG
jgi:hypothetical protein